MDSPVWLPNYRITPSIVQALMTIEGARAVIGSTRLPPLTAAALRRKTKLRATHYSTRIEGNRLTLEQAADVVAGVTPTAAVRERDVLEVKHYWDALERVEAWAERREMLTEPIIQRLHGIVERGARAKPTPYRDGQNVVRDAASGGIIYLPPEAPDVPPLVGALIRWVGDAVQASIPVPIIAALLHYQFVTIHPYYDGNGRTARLLATFVLHRYDYGLNGFVSLEEHHARDLSAYYTALATHPHHNYYEGRAITDLSAWVTYFVTLMAQVFDEARAEVVRLAAPTKRALTPPSRQLPSTRQGRAVLALFAERQIITANDVAATLGISPRMARNYLGRWVAEGWLAPTSVARKNRAYART
ncbi:MAG TPA: Fic family protein [Gemmatimonadaceae bacterium]|nr:Fic family protein [Gemmatimonadaceae bacterium]